MDIKAPDTCKDLKKRLFLKNCPTSLKKQMLRTSKTIES